MTTVETARLALREWSDEDVDALFEIQGDPEAMRYTHAAESRDDCARWHRAYAALDAEHEALGPGIRHRARTRRASARV